MNDGVCIFVHNDLDFTGIDLEKFCKDKDIEACAIKLLQNSYHICILSIYRAPLGNFTYLIKKLETILNSLHTINTQYIICGDININYLIENNRKKVLDALLTSYNLSSTVYFPARLQNNLATAVDNIFVDTSKFPNYVISPLFNGLSDHDAQLIKLSDIDLKIQNASIKIIRKIDTYSVLDFQYKLSFETWNSVFGDNDVNTMFNSFLNIYLRIFYSSFPVRRGNSKINSNAWITIGIRTFCKCKRDLYLLCRNSNNVKLNEYYKLYSKILSNVIKEAKNVTIIARLRSQITK
jgi:hypothetical protein